MGGCGRIAFDENAIFGPDAPPNDAPAVHTCTTFTFDDGQLPPELGTYGIGTITVENGQLGLRIPGARDGEAVVTLATPASFVGHSTAIHVVSPSLTAGASTALGWHEENGDQRGLHLEMDGTNLKLNRYSAPLDQYEELLAVPYDPIELAWWQLREEGGLVIAEVSRDGVAWNRFGAFDGMDLSSMKWDFGMGAYVADVAASESFAASAVSCVPTPN